MPPINLPPLHLLVSFATALLLMHYVPLLQIYIIIISALIFGPLVQYLLSTFIVFGDMPPAISGDDDHQDFPPLPPPPPLSRHPAFRDQDLYGHWDVAPTVKVETVVAEDSTRVLDGHSDVHRDAVIDGDADGPAQRTTEPEDSERLTGGPSNSHRDTVRDRRTIRRTSKFKDLNAPVAGPSRTTVPDRHGKAPARRPRESEDSTTPVDGPSINWDAVARYLRPAVRTVNDSEDSTAPVKRRSRVHKDLSRQESTPTTDNSESSTASIDYRSGRRHNMGREESSAATTDNSEGLTDRIDRRPFYESTSSSSDFGPIGGPSGILVRPPPIIYDHDEWLEHVKPERQGGVREVMAKYKAKNPNSTWNPEAGQS